MGNQTTHWTVIQAAAGGDDAAQAEFARCYEPVIRAFLWSRWKHNAACAADLDDAVQEVFLACFRRDGALAHADARRPGGFRAFLFGVSRNVARRFETSVRKHRLREVGSGFDLDRVDSGEETLSDAFDRAWASMLLKEAVRRQSQDAAEKGESAVRRVELLRLRFQNDLPIRDIARQWNVESSWLHHQYAQAREEFKRALKDVVRDHHGGGAEDVEAECLRLLQFF